MQTSDDCTAVRITAEITVLGHYQKTLHGWAVSVPNSERLDRVCLVLTDEKTDDEKIGPQLNDQGPWRTLEEAFVSQLLWREARKDATTIALQDAYLDAADRRAGSLSDHLYERRFGDGAL